MPAERGSFMKRSRIHVVLNDDLVFDVVDSGPLEGEPVVLLHGFPQTSSSWADVSAHLHQRGYRTFAMNQRGYTPFACPRGRFAYRMSALVRDTIELLNEISAPEVHLVGHDWGAAVAWSTAARHPERVRTLTAVSVPHSAAFVRSMLTSDQALRSFYMGLFQVPWLPEMLIRRNRGLLARALSSTGMPSAQIEAVHEEIVQTGALTGALNWYRAMLLDNPLEVMRKVAVPTTHVWGAKDTALSKQGAGLTQRYVTGDYRFVTLPDATHWIPDQNADELALIIHERASTNRIAPTIPGT